VDFVVIEGIVERGDLGEGRFKGQRKGRMNEKGGGKGDLITVVMGKWEDGHLSTKTKSSIRRGAQSQLLSKKNGFIYGAEKVKKESQERGKQKNKGGKKENVVGQMLGEVHEKQNKGTPHGGRGKERKEKKWGSCNN